VYNIDGLTDFELLQNDSEQFASFLPHNKIVLIGVDESDEAQGVHLRVQRHRVPVQFGVEIFADDGLVQQNRVVNGEHILPLLLLRQEVETHLVGVSGILVVLHQVVEDDAAVLVGYQKVVLAVDEFEQGLGARVGPVFDYLDYQTKGVFACGLVQELLRDHFLKV